jgi:hypothetical protein
MIPNILHYIHLSGTTNRPWKLHHYLSVKSAVMYGEFDKINIWVDVTPTGVYWDKTKEYVNIIAIIPPTDIFDIPITQEAHKSDVLRLQILIEYGGVYVDCDTIFKKPFTNLLNNKCVLGQQGINGIEGLCPAVILAEKNSKFCKIWLSEFKTHFKGGPPGSPTWCTHSVYLPNSLSHILRDDITIMNHEYFFWPMYHEEHMKILFEENINFKNAFSHHLWESSGKQYLDSLTIDDIKKSNTTFSNLVKNLI